MTWILNRIFLLILITLTFLNCETATPVDQNNQDLKTRSSKKVSNNITMEKKNKITPEKIVQKNLDAYNALDIETFMACFHDEIKMYNYGLEKPSAQGLDEVRKIYQGLFDRSPKLHSDIINRIIYANKVIDHESITGRLGNETPIEMVLIYEVQDKKIIKITAIKS